ncbi:hypothetical protein BGZ47_002171 [Haplosporangium gracile]|nr:hypothetical protein BGZ47_002171 [Haplosporangium gracile]
MKQGLGELLARGGARMDRVVALLSLLAGQAAQEPEVVREAHGESAFVRPDLVEETHLILEHSEKALDEMDKKAVEEKQKAQTGIPDSLQPKEPSRAHQKAVQAIPKILMELPNLGVACLNTAWVRQTAHKPEDFTDVKCQTLVEVAKALDPYTPKRVPSSSGKTSSPTANAASMIRIAEMELRSARKAVDTSFLSWLQKDEELRIANATRYALQSLSRTKPNYDPPSQQRSYKARLTWVNPAAEAKTENLFIDCLLDAVLADPTRAIGFDVDGSGVSSSALVENFEESKSSQEQEEAIVVLPPVHSITTGQINNLSFTAKHQRRRQKRLAADTPEADATRSALADLPRNSINNESRTTRVYTTLAARQRHKVKDIVLAKFRGATALDHQIKGSVTSNDVDSDLSKPVVFEDILDVAARPEDANPEAIRCVTDQPKVTEDPISKERLNASTKRKGAAIETIEDTMATRSKSKHIVWLKGLRCKDTYVLNFITLM